MSERKTINPIFIGFNNKPIIKRISLIGSAFRAGEAKYLTTQSINKMKQKFKSIIDDEIKLPHGEIILVSGGSSGADHLAVELFLNAIEEKNPFAGIELYLPARWDKVKKQFDVNSHPDASRLNQLHYQFSSKLSDAKQKSLNEIAQLVDLQNKGSTFEILIHDEPIGFKSRNTLIAKQCDYLIAQTFHKNRDELNKATASGTADTWKKCKLPDKCKFHASI